MSIIRTAIIVLVSGLCLSSCKDTEPTKNVEPIVNIPDSYVFNRDGRSTVSFTGQTERIRMAEELGSALTDFSKSESDLLEMFRNLTESGGDADPFSEELLNRSSKSLREKIAASADYFSANTTEAVAIRNLFESWIKAQVQEVFPASMELAAPGKAGQIASGTRTRYISAKGFEYDQFFKKGLLGALMLDQMLNNYLSPSVLDADMNRSDQETEKVVDENAYTRMEHYWDEAYGYLFGNAQDPANPLPALGTEDGYMNEYVGQVDADPDFAGIGKRIYDAFKAGRAAIVQREYGYRDARVKELRKDLSAVMAIRAMYYLESGATQLENDQKGSAFHSISEAYGFIYSLRFTRNPDTAGPYFDRTETNTLLGTLTDSGSNGFWDLKPETLRQLSAQIGARFKIDPALTRN
ncbi:MAG: DUF4856 domain-containing protein [Flavobacteriales bacterium]|nr:DUF4856 domain-containing protein [Flavobacteriales bacterium]